MSYNNLTWNSTIMSQVPVGSGNWKKYWKKYESNSCTGLVGWQNGSFDDSSWAVVSDVSTDFWNSCDDCDMYLRRVFYVYNTAPASLTVSSDDGHWLYVNGVLVGQCGAGCHGGGTCSQGYDVSSYLNKGRNVIAVQCSEHGGGEVCSVTSSTLNISGVTAAAVIPAPNQTTNVYYLNFELVEINSRYLV